MRTNGDYRSLDVDIVEVFDTRATKGTSESEVKAQEKQSTGILATITNKFKSLVGYTGTKREVTAGSSANATSITGGAQEADATKTTNAAASTEKFGNFDYGEFKRMSEDEKMAFITKISKRSSLRNVRLFRNIEKAIGQDQNKNDAYLCLANFALGGKFDYSKFEKLSNLGKDFVFDTMAKMPDEEKSRQLGYLDEAINQNQDDADLRAMKFAMSGDFDHSKFKNLSDWGRDFV